MANTFFLINTDQIAEQEDATQLSGLYLHPSIHHNEIENDFQTFGSYLNCDHQNQSDRIQRWKNESFLFSILYNENDVEQSVTEINGQFVCSQLLIHYLLHTPLKDKNECIKVFERSYPQSSEKIDEFKRDYKRENALLWYTKPSFLSIPLNRALRQEKIDFLFLFLFRFFIRDLEHQLAEYQCQTRMDLYRGQLIPDIQLELLKNSIGKLISISSFFSTTTERHIAEFFLGDTAVIDDKQRALFIIDADPNDDEIKPFAYISRFSQFPDEKEVLMMLRSVFRVDSVYPEEKDNGTIWCVHMTLSDSCKHELRSIIDSTIREMDDGIETKILSFGDILTQMGKFDYAEKYYHYALNELSDDADDLSYCYYGLGVVAWKKNRYDDSLKYHQDALQLRKKLYKSNHPIVADSYNAIGTVFRSKSHIKKALICYKRALVIFQKAPDFFYDRIAGCHNNIACIYENQKKYFKAFRHHYKALYIRRKYLPEVHCEVSDSYHNIGNIYKKWHLYSHALKFYKKSLDICRKTLASNHSDIAMRLENIGRTYMAKKQFQKALNYLRQAQTIYLCHSLNNYLSLTNIEWAIEHIQVKAKLN